MTETTHGIQPVMVRAAACTNAAACAADVIAALTAAADDQGAVGRGGQ